MLEKDDSFFFTDSGKILKKQRKRIVLTQSMALEKKRNKQKDYLTSFLLFSIARCFLLPWHFA